MLAPIVLALSAYAADLPEVALVPLDGAPGTSSERMSVVVRGVAGALQASHHVVPVYDVELADRTDEASGDKLHAARDALSEGRRLLTEGDADLSLAFLQQAVDEHREAGSETVRRDEAADAHYTFARALLLTNDPDRAQTEILRAIRLVPDYMTTRADAVDPTIEAVAARATKALADRPPRRMTDEAAAQLAAEWKVDFVVHGAVLADGSLELVVEEGSKVLYTVDRPGPFAPPAVGDAWYAGIAAQIEAACLHAPIPDDGPGLADADVAPRTAATTTTTPIPTDAPPREPAAPHPTARKSAPAWILWAGVGVLATGAAGAAAYAYWPQPATPAPTWTLDVESP